MPASFSPLVTRVAESVAREGLRSAVIGRAQWAALRGEPAPADATLLCEASAERLHRLPGVVCLGRGLGVRASSRAGAILLLPSGGAPLETALENMAWTLLGCGTVPRTGEVLDPCGGSKDLHEGRLKPSPSLAAGRLRGVDAVAAIRLATQEGLSPTGDARTRLAEAASDCAAPGGARLRHELEALLMSPRARLGLDLLQSTGIETHLVPGASESAAQLVAESPAHLTARWTAWLLGVKASRVLSRLRMPRDRARAIEARLAYARTEQAIAPKETSVRRAVARLGSADAVRESLDLRLRELRASGVVPPEVEQRLGAITALLDAPVGPRLIWTGRDVMKQLDLPAGPGVGQALAFLRQRVTEEPSGNTPTQLGRWLQEWVAATLDPAHESE